MQSQPSGVPFGNIRLCLDKTASPDFFMTKIKIWHIYFFWWLLFVCFWLFSKTVGLDPMRVAYVSHIRWESNPRSSGKRTTLKEERKHFFWLIFFLKETLLRYIFLNFHLLFFFFILEKKKKIFFGILLLIKEMLLKMFFFWILNFLFNFEKRIKIFSDLFFYFIFLNFELSFEFFFLDYIYTYFWNK